MARSFYNETGFNFAAALAEEYNMQIEPFKGCTEEIKIIREDINSRTAPNGYKKLNISEEMDQFLLAHKIINESLEKNELFNILGSVTLKLAQEAQTIKSFLEEIDKVFIY